jgi:hypothetical protein
LAKWYRIEGSYSPSDKVRLRRLSMTKKQFDELLKVLKGIEAALLLLRVPNTVYVPSQPTYSRPTYSRPPCCPPITTPIITCNTGQNSEVK